MLHAVTARLRLLKAREWMTMVEAGAFLALSRGGVRCLIRRGHIRVQKVPHRYGSLLLLDAEDVRARRARAGAPLRARETSNAASMAVKHRRRQPRRTRRPCACPGCAAWGLTG